jgi:outer membrane protein OmpA-like peptidoglycan-associated protein
MKRSAGNLASVGILALTAIASLGIASADTIKAEGLIKARSGATMTLKTPDSDNLVVLLTDSTKVGQVEGVLKLRKKELSMAALIPGLAVKVEGNYNDLKQLVAASVSFKGNDLERAKAMQAGMHETQVQTAENKAELQKQQAALQAQKEALEQQHKELTAQQEKIAANKLAINAAAARFGQLDDYYILDELKILFANGKSNIGAEYKPQLMQFAEKAKKVDAYMIQVVGYASAAGSQSLNQKLSEDRAAAVANFLSQDGHVPLTNMLAPGAMGESRQVGDDKTAEGQAENRRVIVRVLQNKGITGP